MSYGYSILGIQITNDMKEFEKDYANWQEKQRKYNEKPSSNTRRKAAEKAWNKALETARKLNNRGRLTEDAARRMKLEWNSPVVSPVNTVDPITGGTAPTGSNLPATIPDLTATATTSTTSSLVPLLVGGAVFAVIAGVLLLRKKR